MSTKDKPAKRSRARSKPHSHGEASDDGGQLPADFDEVPRSIMAHNWPAHMRFMQTAPELPRSEDGHRSRMLLLKGARTFLRRLRAHAEHADDMLAAPMGKLILGSQVDKRTFRKLCTVAGLLGVPISRVYDARARVVALVDEADADLQLLVDRWSAALISHRAQLLLEMRTEAVHWDALRVQAWHAAWRAAAKMEVK